MSSAIMDQNEFEKLLQRVLNEVQYKKVKDFLERESTHQLNPQGSQVDFFITNANSSVNQVMSKKNTSRTLKPARLTGQFQKQLIIQDQTLEQEPLNIQARKIVNPQQICKQES
jgi:hypothetical protein